MKSQPLCLWPSSIFQTVNSAAEKEPSCVSEPQDAGLAKVFHQDAKTSFQLHCLGIPLNQIWLICVVFVFSRYYIHEEIHLCGPESRK